MNQAFIAFVVLGTISYGIVAIIRSFTDFKLKKQLIEKATVNEDFSSALSDSIKILSSRGEENRYPALKWGLVCFFGGLGLVLIEYMNFDSYNSPLPYGIVSASVSLGFLLYFFLAKREDKKHPHL